MSIKNSGNSIENSFGEERVPLRHKKVGLPNAGSSCCIVNQFILLTGLLSMAPHHHIVLIFTITVMMKLLSNWSLLMFSTVQYLSIDNENKKIKIGFKFFNLKNKVNHISNYWCFLINSYIVCIYIYINAYPLAIKCHFFHKLGCHPKSPMLFLPYAGLTQIQHSGQLPFHRQIL